MKKYSVIVGLVVLLLAACSQQQNAEILETQATNYWKNLGGALDVVTKNNTAYPKLLLDRNGKPVVVWAEDNGLWYLQGKRWTGATWEKLPLPTKALAYNDNGVNPFDVAFDGSNALVVSQVVAFPNATNASRVEVSRAMTSAWVSLGTFNGLVQLQTNAAGQVHAIFQNYTNGNNIVKRWDGVAWRTVAHFREFISDGSSGVYTFADSFLLKTDGNPVISSLYRPRIRVVVDRVLEWNGQQWSQVDGVSGPVGTGIADYALTTSNKIITAITEYDDFTTIRGAGINTGLGSSRFLSLAVKKDFPLVMYQNTRDNPSFGKVFVDGWDGGQLVNLGGDIRRDTAKMFLMGDVVVDKSGTIFALSQEAACFASATCGGADIFVSQYVP
jgi:hypothetical protein